MKSRIRLFLMWALHISSPSMGRPSFKDVRRGSMESYLNTAVREGFALIVRPGEAILYTPSQYRPIVHGNVVFPDWVEWELVRTDDPPKIGGLKAKFTYVDEWKV